MKELTIFIATGLLLIGCSETREQQTLPEKDLNVENASIADCLEIIQGNPKSHVFQQALDHYLLLTESDDYHHVPFTKSLGLRILSNDSVILYGQYCPIDSVRFKCFDYLTFEGPWKSYKSIEEQLFSPFNADTLYFSKGLFDISVAGEPISNDQVQPVFIEISKAIDDYKGYLGSAWFEKLAEDLSYEEDSLIDRTIGTRIQVFHFPDGFPWNKKIKTNPNNG
jgi:hypothetical protein